ncbi:CaiB/BaiF CoA transferase family protein [Pandoraea terrigena]|uniref:Acetyl-CoA:oxalate CoA-transferase n=1 Tax=Pandoraea terrigena TaxID=2508292 RepID=A0A5E4VIU0_9BURK|nr:CaiB/BaiF CoA-transferase family protein [Pandoraea terrigena]VVE12202.1 Acetyl-CoA:oxalate CoA-transferase [Pandoraea terrigena]
MNAPLSGIRVIEFSRGAAAAYCGLLLADMGADVILIDDPVDDISNDSPRPLSAMAHAGLRRNKRSVTLDLLTLEGRSLAHTLVRGADVVIECLPSGALARAGLGYDALSAVQPHLVYASISAFGQDGPRAASQPGVPALDALRGMLGASPGGLEPPRDLPVADLAAGLYAAFSVSSALVAAKQQGRGVHIDVPMLGATLAIAALHAGDAGAQAAHRAGLVPGAMSHEVTGSVSAATLDAAGAGPYRHGAMASTAHSKSLSLSEAQSNANDGDDAARFGGPSAPWPTFRARDGYFGMDLDGQAHWRAICALMHRVDLLDDSRFASARERARHQAALRDVLEAVFVLEDRSVWLARLVAVGVPCTAISTYSRVLADPQVAHMGWVRSMVLPSGETTHTIVSPVRINGQRPVTHQDPPAPGAHTGDILAELEAADGPVAQRATPRQG